MKEIEDVFIKGIFFVLWMDDKIREIVIGLENCLDDWLFGLDFGFCLVG